MSQYPYGLYFGLCSTLCQLDLKRPWHGAELWHIFETYLQNKESP